MLCDIFYRTFFSGALLRLQESRCKSSDFFACLPFQPHISSRLAYNCRDLSYNCFWVLPGVFTKKCKTTPAHDYLSTDIKPYLCISMTSRSELIKAITADFDKKRTAFLSLPYFELYEFVSKDFTVPEKTEFEIRNAKNKYLVRAIIFSIFAGVMTPFFIIPADSFLYFITISLLVFAAPVYQWYEYFNRRIVLLLNPEQIVFGNKPGIPWINILTVHFLELHGKHPREALIVHYLDESGVVQQEDCTIEELEYKPREIASIIQSFLHNLK